MKSQAKAPMFGTLKSKIETMEYPNPYHAAQHEANDSNPKTITVAVNVRESSIMTMKSKGILEPHQVRAADHFRTLWESLGGSGAGAIDYSREHVDGGRIADPISVRQMDSGKQLNECRKVIGVRAYDIVCKIAGEGYSVAELAKTQRDKTTTADYLKHALSDLAEHWGYHPSKGNVRR